MPAKGTERTVNRLSGLLHRIRNRSGGAASTKQKKPKIDKQHRIQIRWLHYDKDKDKYTPVRNRYGGGNRYIAYMDSHPLTLQEIQERACELFFPKGQSHFGSLEDMSKCVTNSAQEVILSFPGSGTISDYLNENGLYPSLTYFYLRTICINSEEDEQTSAQINSNSQLKESEAAHIVNQVIGLTPDTQYSSEATASTASFPSGGTVAYFSHPEFRTVCPICCCTNLSDEECL